MFDLSQCAYNACPMFTGYVAGLSMANHTLVANVIHEEPFDPHGKAIFLVCYPTACNRTWDIISLGTNEIMPAYTFIPGIHMPLFEFLGPAMVF